MLKGYLKIKLDFRQGPRLMIYYVQFSILDQVQLRGDRARRPTSPGAIPVGVRLRARPGKRA